MIQLENVNRVLGGVLKDISFELREGEIIGLFGKNGSGKSTLMKSILQLNHYKGSIKMDGEEITHKNIERLSYASCDNTLFPELTLDEHKAFFKEQFPKFREDRYDFLIKFFDLNAYRDYKVKKLSTGMRNQFEVILALSQGADYIFLDEPFAGNDIFNREDFYKVLSGILEDHETIILATHLVEEVENFVDRILLIKDGKLIAEETIEGIESKNLTLSDYIKAEYHYEKNRAGKAVHELMKNKEE